MFIHILLIYLFCSITDPCLSNNGKCDTNANCTNNAGFAYCTCKSGFSGDGISCAGMWSCFCTNLLVFKTFFCLWNSHVCIKSRGMFWG